MKKIDIKELQGQDLIDFIKNQISNNAEKVRKMIESKHYYEYRQDIDSKRRLAIGDGGKVIEVHNLPNSRLKDNQFAKVVDQKVSYLFSKSFTVKNTDTTYQEELQRFYNKKFMRTLNKVALESFLCGIAWLYVYVDNNKLKYKKMDSTELIPVWKDKEHESLKAMIRTYTKDYLEDGKIKQKKVIEFYTDDVIKVLEHDKDINNYKLIEEKKYITDLSNSKIAYSFNKIPFIYFKSNSKEIPLLDKCKSLQDAINTILSNFQDNMLEDKRNTIISLTNFDGQNLGEFRKNLSQYGAVKLREGGDINTLDINVNAENYKAILEILKEKLIENARGIDVKNNRSTNAPNQLNIKSMHADMELDANLIELEFQASLSHLEYFYRVTKNISGKDTDNIEETDVEFKRNIMINESETVDNLLKSMHILSKKTLVSRHPYLSDLEEELKQIKKEKLEDSEQTTIN